MAQTDSFILSEDIHPIDIVETIANHHEWDFDRLADDQIAMAVEGQWRTYSITLAWSNAEEMLRLICTFDMDPPAERMPALHEAMNMANDQVWDGAFTFWPSQRMMVWRYGLVLAGETTASPEQIDHMIRNAVMQAERLYPAFQLVAWGDTTADAAMDIAMGAAYGRA
ncbi:YbjN domain-containing protein [Paracoccus sp. SCSIO 75233]|uniref:YbjN domain-containing protein n=1 Tax=Paracoccus sp. SCSIO 75233 TaxID=3017782 RepID=UPI0022EFE6EC|nr:YbjN domain-containing protein [Paracoccus sp. SCSIO 75233]WBU52600.1 YbjN domain-containing protein [Paracoccus sp. SCSIO 75233]